MENGYDIARDLTGQGYSVTALDLEGCSADDDDSWMSSPRVRTEDELQQLFPRDKPRFVALALGACSRNLQVIEIKGLDLYEELTEKLKEQDIDQDIEFVVQKTGLDDFRLFFRCDQLNYPTQILYGTDLMEGQLAGKVVKRSGMNAFEVWSPKGFPVPTARQLETLSGDLLRIPELTQEQLQTVRRVCSELTTEVWIADLETPQWAEAEEFNLQADWAEILAPHMTKIPKENGGRGCYWRSNNCDSPDGCVAITKHKLTTLCWCVPFERGLFQYNKFIAFALLNHEGHIQAALDDLRERGYTGNEALLSKLNKWTGEPRPLFREIDSPGEYPIELLPEILKTCIITITRIINAPMALVAQSVLAAASLAAQGVANVELDGRVSPLSENFLTVAASGERKSAVDQEVLRGHREFEKYRMKTYNEKLRLFEIAKLVHDDERKKILRQQDLSGSDKQSQLSALSTPEPPIRPNLIAEEPTYEGVIKHFSHGQNSLGIFSDEGGRFLGGFSMLQENELKTLAGFSRLWDGNGATRMRSSEDPIILDDARLSLHLMIQPIVAKKLLANNIATGQGFLSRCLTVWPSSTAGTRHYVEQSVQHSSEVERYTKRVRHLLELNHKPLKTLHLTADAKALWITFYEDTEQKIRAGGKFESMGGFASKAAEHAIRLSGIVSLFDDPEKTMIEVEAVEAGIALVEFYLNEVLRLQGTAFISPDLLLADKLLGWLKGRENPFFTTKEVYQCGPTELRSAKPARANLHILKEHGYIRQISGPDQWELRLTDGM